VPDDVAEHLLIALREMLSNVARHAQARHAVVDVTVGDELDLVVTDDGKGGAVGPTAVGHGVRNLVQRAEALGGEFTLGPGEDAVGTRARWQVPLTL